MLARIASRTALFSVCCLALVAPLAHAADAKGKMTVRSYAVADLVIPINRVEAAVDPAVEKSGKPQPATEQDRLIQLLVSTIQPTSWQQNGGRGSIQYFPMTMALVINQTPAIQEQIADLLKSLRRMQDVEVALEVRVMTTSDGVLQSVDVKGNEPAFLNAAQVKEILEEAQGDRRTNIMQVPKITLFNGQTGTVNALESQVFVTGLEMSATGDTVNLRPKTEVVSTGFRMTAQPIVSADRRFVQLDLKLEQSDLDSLQVPAAPLTVTMENKDGKPAQFTQCLQQPKITRMTLEKKLAIPDGGTVLFGGLKKVTESRNEYGPPVLSKIPYVNRLFKNVAYCREAQDVVVMVTPRIIINEEKEETAKAGPFADHVGEGLTATVGSEETQEPETPVKPTKSVRQEKAVSKLLKAYDAACAEGRTAEARKLARAALTIDPTCFHRQP